GIKILKNQSIAPNGELTADKIIGTGNNDGYVLQGFPKIEGTFEWSMWLKGSGTTQLKIQENGNDYTSYHTYKIQLTPNWKRYSLIGTKDNDKKGIRAVLSGIQTTDTLYAWGAKFVEVKENLSDQKSINSINVTEKEDKVYLDGWMQIKNEIIADKFIALKKDNEFSYVS
ncbi:unnamed protein product, partial [Ectocarpus sp. 4 AP-2014]